MQEIVGDKNQFAIQWEITEFYVDECYGSICFWIGGEEIGEYQNEVTLDTSLFHLNNFNKHKNIRSYKDSHLLSKEELFFELYEKFFGEVAKSNGDYLNLGIYRAIFWITEIGDSSTRDKYNIILIDEPSAKRQRFIWKSIDTSTDIKEHFIPMDYFEKVGNQFYNRILSIWKSE